MVKYELVNHNIGSTYGKSENTLYQTEVQLKSYDGMLFIRDISSSMLL